MNLWPRYLILILLLLFTAPAAVWAQSEDNIDANLLNTMPNIGSGYRIT